MNNERALTFYFDYISNNAYIAWVKIQEIAKTYNVRIEPVPVLFAGLLNAHGQKGPAEIPSKRTWMRNNVLRKANELDIPLNPPASHPFNPLLALRATLIKLDNKKRNALITELFECVWAKSIDVSQTDIVTNILARYGIDEKTAQTELTSEELKLKLRENTDTAVQSGVFGVPTIVVNGELFWGYDDFPYLIRFLEGNDSLQGADVASWTKVKKTASRN